ncbi:MAG TPA: hypothetical protein PKE21_03800 [Flavobacteriales bacterium]|nr:hypothetical protein [Flavobacteriales bacterium]HMR26580.1 hypothetical protein [Flavobacteriales bacterium]
MQRPTAEPVHLAQRDTTALPDGSPVLPTSDDQVLADSTAAYLLRSLRDDLPAMSATDRRFQVLPVDLNDDGRPERFIRFMSPWFCGSGGCTLLLLDDQWTILTRFTVTDPPLFATSTRTDGWRDLMVSNGGRWRILHHGADGYPSNPSVVPPTDLAPSGHDLLIFHDTFAPCRTWTY